MPHVDPDDLPLLALGEPASDELAAHLADCPECREELAALRAAVRIGRRTDDRDRLVAPHPRVWQGIRAELGMPASPPRPSPPRPSPLRLSPSRRSRRRLVLAGAALVAAGVVTAVVLVGLPRPQVLAAAALEARPGWAGASGEAQLERLPDGSRELHLTLTTPAVGDDYREVWLLARSGDALVSLGVVGGDGGVYAVPDDLDLARYDVVDVSREPPDGDPAHSTDSIVRGTLRAAGS